jgi:hypothetical protein
VIFVVNAGRAAQIHKRSPISTAFYAIEFRVINADRKLANYLF